MFYVINNHSAAKAISFGLVALTGLTYMLYHFHSRKLQEFKSKITDLDSNISKSFKSLEKVLVKGTAMKKTIPLKNQPTLKYLIKRKVDSFLDNRFVNIKTTERIGKSDFVLGRNFPVEVKLDALRVIEGRLVKEVITEKENNFFRKVLGFYQKEPCYSRTSSHVVPLDSQVYIKGTVVKSKENKTVIMAEKVFTSKESFLYKYSSKVRDAKIFLVACVLAFITFGLSLTVVKYKDPEAPAGFQCSKCSRSASAILYPCYHLVYCRSCLLLSETCSSCGSNISSHIKITS